MIEAMQYTTDDDLRLKGKVWLPKSTPSGVVCLIHGFGEHIDRYEHVAKSMNDAGLALCGIDLRGHGMSEGKRGHTPSFDHLMRDIDQYIKGTRTAYPGLPIHLYGHSMGGNLAINYLLRFPHADITSAVITSPWLRLRFDPPKIKVVLGKVMRNVYPKYTESNNLDPNHLSRDKSIGEKYAADPLVNDKITTEMYFAMTEAGEWAIANAKPFTIPVLITHGESDPITSPDASREFASKAKTQYKRWPEMYHETHNEIGKEQVISEIIDWFKSPL